MRWTALFADLEGRSAELERADRAAEVAERTRIETGRVGLTDRIGAAHGSDVRVRLIGGLDVVGAVVRVGHDWFVVADPVGERSLVMLRAVRAVAAPAGAAAVSGSGGPTPDRPPAGQLLRWLCVERVPVVVRCVDATEFAGTVDRVGRDFVDLAVRADRERPAAGTSRCVVAIRTAVIALVRWSA